MLECYPLSSDAPPITPTAREAKVWRSVWNYTDARKMQFRTSPSVPCQQAKMSPPPRVKPRGV
ncbi:hypothetical protein E2C01_054331 [Portunus trituberculatus]|uniref:Uncharacterized protein n=1 Tax=Portunus trituberculatus TaxID=210409 RepID=A0A5B7GN68_PORTR|nr:hypothetical protein [Portunus trituberculatus]